MENDTIITTESLLHSFRTKEKLDFPLHNGCFKCPKIFKYCKSFVWQSYFQANCISKYVFFSYWFAFPNIFYGDVYCLDYTFTVQQVWQQSQREDAGGWWLIYKNTGLWRDFGVHILHPMGCQVLATQTLVRVMVRWCFSLNIIKYSQN